MQIKMSLPESCHKWKPSQDLLRNVNWQQAPLTTSIATKKNLQTE